MKKLHHDFSQNSPRKRGHNIFSAASVTTQGIQDAWHSLDQSKKELTMDASLELSESWRELAHQYALDLGELIDPNVLSSEDKVRLIRHSLHGKLRFVTWHLIRTLNDDEKKLLLPELLDMIAGYHGAWEQFADHILDLPRAWVIQHAPKYVDSIIVRTEADLTQQPSSIDRESDVEDAYLCFLNFYALLDNDLCRNLAQRALIHPMEHVRSQGADFLDKCDAEV